MKRSSDCQAVLKSSIVAQEPHTSLAVVFLVDRFLYWADESSRLLRITNLLHKFHPSVPIAPQLVIRKARVYLNSGTLRKVPHSPIGSVSYFCFCRTRMKFCTVCLFKHYEKCIRCRQTTEGRVHSEQPHKQQRGHRSVAWAVFITLGPEDVCFFCFFLQRSFKSCFSQVVGRTTRQVTGLLCSQ